MERGFIIVIFKTDVTELDRATAPESPDPRRSRGGRGARVAVSGQAPEMSRPSFPVSLSLCACPVPLIVRLSAQPQAPYGHRRAGPIADPPYAASPRLISGFAEESTGPTAPVASLCPLSLTL